MRKHIGQSLKNRSKSIQNAITNYNEAAAALHPPRRKISWDQIIDFSYLLEFNILRDTQEDVRERKWATPQNRLLMSQFFKFIRAEEELARVHVEVKRLLTYMVDEERVVCGKAAEVSEENPALALQLSLYWKERSRFNAAHRSCLFSITKLKGFDQANRHYWTVGTHVTQDVRTDGLPAEGAGEWEEEEEEDDIHEFESRVTAVLDMTFDVDQ